MNFARTKIVIVAIFVAMSALRIFGQEAVITRAEFEKVMTATDKPADGKTVRTTTIIEQVVDGVVLPEKTRLEIYEEIPPNRTRELDISVVRGKEQSSESIKIGSRTWVRTNNGRWVRNNTVSSGPDTAAMVTSESYNSKGKSMLSGVEFSVYEKVERWTTYSFGAIVEEEVETTTYWIDKNGLCLREVTETENLKDHKLDRRTTTVEYNPKDLKITAPISRGRIGR